MARVPPISTRTDTHFPYTTLCRSETSNTYFGATCGRYGNRIRNGQFFLNGQRVQVACNEPPNHLHGWEQGLDKQLWNATVNEGENRSEEHTSELQSLMRISYAIFCLQQNNKGHQSSPHKTI